MKDAFAWLSIAFRFSLAQAVFLAGAHACNQMQS